MLNTHNNVNQEDYTGMGSHVIKILHTGISVKDMEVSLEWYERIMGFKKTVDFYAPPLGARICFIEREDLGYAIELFQYDDPKPIPSDRLVPNTDLQTIGTKHMAVQMDDAKATREFFVENNVDIAHEVTMEGESVIFIRDPDGVLIEFIQK